MLSWQSLIFINKSTVISIFLLFGAQVFFYPESKKHLSKMRERGAWPSSHGEEKASWENSAIDLKQKAKTHSQASPLPQHIPIRPCLSPGNPKILTWSCNVPCGQTLVQRKAWELLSSLLQKCHSASLLSHYSFPISENNTNIFNSLIFGIEMHTGKKILYIQCLYLASLESKQKILYFAQTCQLLHFNYSDFYPLESTNHQILLSNNMGTDSLQ